MERHPASEKCGGQKGKASLRGHQGGRTAAALEAGRGTRDLECLFCFLELRREDRRKMPKKDRDRVMGAVATEANPVLASAPPVPSRLARRTAAETESRLARRTAAETESRLLRRALAAAAVAGVATLAVCSEIDRYARLSLLSRCRGPSVLLLSGWPGMAAVSLSESALGGKAVSASLSASLMVSVCRLQAASSAKESSSWQEGRDDAGGDENPDTASAYSALSCGCW